MTETGSFISAVSSIVGFAHVPMSQHDLEQLEREATDLFVAGLWDTFGHGVISRDTLQCIEQSMLDKARSLRYVSRNPIMLRLMVMPYPLVFATDDGCVEIEWYSSKEARLARKIALEEDGKLVA